MEQTMDNNGNIRFRSNVPPVEPKSIYAGYEDYLGWAYRAIEGLSPKDQKQLLKWWKSKNAKQTWGTVKAGRMREALRHAMGVVRR